MPLVGYWPLNETSGNTAQDYSGQGNDGSLKNGAGPSGTGTVTGPLGQSAYSFDGSDDYVDLPDVSVGNTFTVSVWVKADTIDSSRDTFVGGYDNDSDSWQFFLAVDNDGEFHFGQNDGSLSPQRTFGSPSTGEWHHLAAAGDGNTTKIYLNGREMAEGSVSGFHQSPLEPHFGSSTGSVNFFHGNISEVRLYNHALTPREIQYLYETAQRGRMVTGKRRG